MMKIKNTLNFRYIYLLFIMKRWGQVETRAPLFSKENLRRLIVPLMIEQLLTVTVGMADTMMVSAAGEAAISGVSLVDNINLLIINILSALTTGGAVVASQYLGQKDRRDACESAKQLLLTALLFSLAMAAVALIFNRGLLSLTFGSIDADVMENAVTYFWISALSYPFIALYNSCTALYRSMGNSKVSMYTSLLMNVINIGGNAYTVFVLHMGAAGVAVASLASRIVAAVIMLVLVHNSKNEIYVRHLHSIRPHFPMIKKILYIGIPNGFENGLFQLGKILVLSLVSSFGTTAIAANAVANNLSAICVLPGNAISLAMITVVGQCVGAMDYGQARTYTKRLVRMSTLYIAAVGALIVAALPLILNIYQLSPDTTRTASEIIIFYCICAAVMWSFSFVLPNALRASNDVKFTMIVSVASMWTFRIGFSFVLGKFLHMGLFGVWVAMVIDWVCRITFFLLRFRGTKWQKFGRELSPEEQAMQSESSPSAS